MPLQPISGSLGPKRAAHLLHRATFGASIADVNAFSALTAQQALLRLFPSTLPDPILPIDPLTNQPWLLEGTTNANTGDSDLQEFFKGWCLAQMLSPGVTPALSLAYSTREKVVFFMHTVLTAIQSKIDNSRALYFQNQLLRQFAFDRTAPATVNFKELTKKISVDNAMVRLLDGNLNVNGSPNENYARELLELYSIGRGLEGHLPTITDPGDYYVFREADVQAAARVLSGWDLLNFNNLGAIPDVTNINYTPNPNVPMDVDTRLPRARVRGNSTNVTAHDNGVKQFSDRFDNRTVQPNPQLLNGNAATEASMQDEISQLIELIYSKRETAKNICRRIYRHFVYHQITLALDNTIIEQMTDTFIQSGYKLQPVLEDLFQSQHFYDAAAGATDDNFGGIIKSPLDLMMGTYRFFEIALPDYRTNATAFYEETGRLIRSLSDMGMNYYEPFDVSGFDAYHQFPIYHRSWISTNYLTRRYEFVRDLIAPPMMMNGAPAIDLVAFVRTRIPVAIAANAQQLVIELAKFLLPLSDNLTFDTNADNNSGLTAERLNFFLTAFIKSPQIDPNPEAAWNFRWTNDVDREVVRTQLTGLFQALLQSPEYQLF